MNLQEVGWGVDCIHVAQERDSLRALVNEVIDLRGPQDTGNFFNSRGPVTFSGGPLLHLIS